MTCFLPMVEETVLAPPTDLRRQANALTEGSEEAFQSALAVALFHWHTEPPTPSSPGLLGEALSLTASAEAQTEPRVAASVGQGTYPVLTLQASAELQTESLAPAGWPQPAPAKAESTVWPAMDLSGASLETVVGPTGMERATSKAPQAMPNVTVAAAETSPSVSASSIRDGLASKTAATASAAKPTFLEPVGAPLPVAQRKAEASGSEAPPAKDPAVRSEPGAKAAYWAASEAQPGLPSPAPQLVGAPLMARGTPVEGQASDVRTRVTPTTPAGEAEVVIRSAAATDAQGAEVKGSLFRAPFRDPAGQPAAATRAAEPLAARSTASGHVDIGPTLEASVGQPKAYPERPVALERGTFRNEEASALTRENPALDGQRLGSSRVEPLPRASVPALQSPSPASSGSAEATSVERPIASPTNGVEVVRQVIHHTRHLGLLGRQELRLQLQPPALGELHVHVKVEDGGVTVRMTAENAIVKNLLEANLVQLQSALHEQGLRPDRLLVQVNQDGLFFDSNSRGSRQGEGSEAHRGAGADEDQESTAATGAPAWGLTGLIDYRV